MKKLKSLCFLLSMVLGSTVAFGQPARTVQSQKYYENKKKIYFPKTDPQIKVMKDNWGMYFREDVASAIDKNAKDYLFEIKLDSYGSVYPDSKILAAISNDDFEGEAENKKYLESHSFYWLFKTDMGKIDSAIQTTKNAAIYNSLLELAQGSSTRDEDEFFNRWDSLHNAEIIDLINEKITRQSFERVIFFVPGFNVPYSLQVLQAINMYKIIKDTVRGLDRKTLFIPLYWPSNNEKLKNLDQAEFSTENIKTYSGNGALFLRYSNRCYYSAITLRDIVNKIDSKVAVDMISHSLGATIVTTSLINTSSKLHYNKNSRLREHAKDSIWVKKANRDNFRGRDNLHIDILKRLYQLPIPSREICVFLSAPAIPGKNTFIDMDPVKMKNKRFYSTINQYDEMVTKSDIVNQVKKKIYISIKAINAHRLGATSLGCNADKDADQTKEFYEKTTGIPDSFKVKIVSTEWDHDLFTYVQQKDYKEFLLEFLKKR